MTRTLMAQMRSVKTQVVDMVFPPTCVLCRDFVQEEMGICPSCWGDLSFITHPYCPKTGLPLEFEVEGETGIADLINEETAYDRARTALIYDDKSRPLILAFKHGDRTLYQKIFAPMMVRAGKDILPRKDMIVPVPLHRFRMARRMYNQSALLAASISGVSDIPWMPDVLRRVRSTKTQGKLSRKDRIKNVKKAFAIPEKYATLVKDKRILLVDDVMTTGATLNECAKVLYESGAECVDVLTVARTVRR